MVAFVWGYKISGFIAPKIKPIKIKKHGHKAISVFRYGLEYLSRILISKYNNLDIKYLKFLSLTVIDNSPNAIISKVKNLILSSVLLSDIRFEGVFAQQNTKDKTTM